MPTFPKARRSAFYHKREAHGRRKNDNKKLYDSKRWRDLRGAWIQNNPLCVQCGEDATGRRGVVDHIKPVNEGGERFSYTNLQTLCNKCHNIKSGTEAHRG